MKKYKIMFNFDKDSMTVKADDFNTSDGFVRFSITDKATGWREVFICAADKIFSVEEQA